MLLAVISDTHLPKGGRELPAGCVALLERADVILHAGDFSERSVLCQLKRYGPLAGVHGNVDAPDLQALLPRSRVVEAAGARIAMVHDAGSAIGRRQRLRAQFPDADAVVFGHSHMPLHERDEEGFAIFNPGSPTERRRAPRHTIGLAHVHAGDVRFELVSVD